MTAVAGVAAPWPRHQLERDCRNSILAQSLYSERVPTIVTVEGASFAVALYDTNPEDANDRQPLVAGPCLFVADARVDNREELLNALNDPRLSNASADSEILLAGWARWKHGLFDRLIGSYAFAIFDSASRTAILARGPAGDRPLCYRLTGGVLRFASMPSGVFDGSSFSPNIAGLARSMVHGDTALGETAFAEVAAVLPAHFLEWTPRGHRLVRFWRPPAVDRRKTGDVIGEFRERLAESVRCRLRRVGGPVASHLSSGLDSGGVTATAARLLADRGDLIAFTMAPAPAALLSVPPRYRADETLLATKAARLLRIQCRVVSHSGPLLDCLRGHARTYQAPVPNVTNHGWGQAIDEQAAGSGARVLLSATQGNASLSYGAIGLVAEWLQRGQLVEYLRQAHHLVRSGGARWRGVIFYSTMDYLPKLVSNRVIGYLPDTPADLFIRNEWKARVEKDKIGSDYRAAGLRQDQYEMYSHHDPGMFIKATLAQMGLDERDPGADQRLIEFCLTLPAEQYINNGVTRRLAREGLADRLPESIIENKVRGYQGADWFAKLDPRSALDWIEEISASHSAAQILDFAALRNAIADWERIASLPPLKLRQWGNRFTRALAVGAFLLEAERYYLLLGRRF